MLDKSLSSSGLGPVNRIKARRIRARRAFHFYHSSLTSWQALSGVATASSSIFQALSNWTAPKCLNRSPFQRIPRPVALSSLGKPRTSIEPDSDNVPTTPALAAIPVTRYPADSSQGYGGTRFWFPSLVDSFVVSILPIS